MWLNLSLRVAPLSAEEKAKPYQSKHLHNQLLFCAVTFVSEAFCECGCRLWHALISAVSHHSSFSHQCDWSCYDWDFVNQF